MIKKYLRLFILLIFLGQIGYMSYNLPQIILLDLEWSNSIKLSASIAGICTGLLYFLKESFVPTIETSETDKDQDLPSDKIKEKS